MRQYLNLLQSLLLTGESRPTRAKLASTGEHVNALSLFAQQIRFDLRLGFPLVTTKKVSFQSILTEIIWFLNGDTNIRYLQKHRCSIWDEWADADGEVGPVYGHQWRDWGGTEEIVPDRQFGDVVGEPGVDQIKNLIEGIKKDPFGRRHIVSAWNVADVPKMKLPCCHILFQCYESQAKELSLHLFMRSWDAFLGGPYNIASYALLIHLLAHVCGLKVGELVISATDAHLYSNHVEQAVTQLRREPVPLPTLILGGDISPDLKGLRHDHFVLQNYKCHPAIKAEVAI